MSDTGIADSASRTGPQGLTSAEVEQRVRSGLVNVADERTSRTLGEIFRVPKIEIADLGAFDTDDPEELAARHAK